MSFIITILVIFGIYHIISSFIRKTFSRTGNQGYGNYTNEQRRNSEQRRQEKEPETQEERIISFQKKSFETEDVKDVDFEEIKE